MNAWLCSAEHCGRELPASHTGGDPCPFCSHVGRIAAVEITERVVAYDSLRIKKKNSTFPSKKRERLDDFQGWELRQETGEIVKKIRVIDKDADTYLEHVEDRDGNVLHHSEEPLKQHQGHGSAKSSKGIRRHSGT